MGGYYSKGKAFSDRGRFCVAGTPRLTSLHTLYMCVPHVVLLILPFLDVKHVYILGVPVLDGR